MRIPPMVIRKLLLAFLPILAYLAVEAEFGELWGIACGIAIALGSFLWTLVRERRIEWLSLADFALIAALGGVSLASGEGIWFRLKPALASLGMAAFCALPSFGGRGAAEAMVRKMVGDMPAAAGEAMARSFRLLFFALALHAILAGAAALWAGEALWAFAAGPLLYIMLGGAVLGGAIAARRTREETLPVVDAEGRVTGKAPRSLCHSGSMLLHPVAHLLVLDGKGGLLLQKRASTKLVQPGKWDASVGGHVAFGEELAVALARESAEEIGIAPGSPGLSAPRPALRLEWKSEVERELIFLSLAFGEGPFRAQASEVDELRFWTGAEIDAALGKGLLTPLLEAEIGELRKLHPRFPRGLP